MVLGGRRFRPGRQSGAAALRLGVVTGSSQRPRVEFSMGFPWPRPGGGHLAKEPSDKTPAQRGVQGEKVRHQGLEPRTR